MTEPTDLAYTIATLRDFLLIPEDRLSECLYEFKSWLACTNFMAGLHGDPDRLIIPPFIWCDDGLKNLSVSIVDPEGETLFSLAGKIKR